MCSCPLNRRWVLLDHEMLPRQEAAERGAAREPQRCGAAWEVREDVGDKGQDLHDRRDEGEERGVKPHRKVKGEPQTGEIDEGEGEALGGDEMFNVVYWPDEDREPEHDKHAAEGK